MPEDEKLHNKHHEAVTTIARFRGWTNEDAMEINDWVEHSGRIIHLQPNHKNIESHFVTEIIGKMEMEFGVQDDYKQLHIYLAAFDSKIVGLATVKDSVLAKAEQGEERLVTLGIQRLFVRPEFRRKGIAKAILRTIAIMHQKGELLDLRNDVAFSTPTYEGKKLIRSVLNTDEVFIFTS